MAVKIKHGTVVCAIGQFRPLAILQHKSRRAICLYELASLSQNSDDFAFIPGVVDKNVAGDTIAAMLSDQHGHAVDDINKHIVLKKDCGNAVADFEFRILYFRLSITNDESQFFCRSVSLLRLIITKLFNVYLITHGSQISNGAFRLILLLS